MTKRTNAFGFGNVSPVTVIITIVVITIVIFVGYYIYKFLQDPLGNIVGAATLAFKEVGNLLKACSKCTGQVDIDGKPIPATKVCPTSGKPLNNGKCLLGIGLIVGLVISLSGAVLGLGGKFRTLISDQNQKITGDKPNAQLEKINIITEERIKNLSERKAKELLAEDKARLEFLEKTPGATDETFNKLSNKNELVQEKLNYLSKMNMDNVRSSIRMTTAYSYVNNIFQNASRAGTTVSQSVKSTMNSVRGSIIAKTSTTEEIKAKKGTGEEKNKAKK